ncbi:MAG: hypothetical protein Q8M08_07520 [Bacteroidales bacterium]|nr:hypothetical protein [Bacteroidales bacterium]
MKKIAILLYLGLSALNLVAQSTVTIGYGADSQPYPYNLNYGYTRSASIYTAAEIGGSCIITSLGWNVVDAAIEICPVKIYLKNTSGGTLFSTTWSSLISGATLVFDLSAGFSTTGWKTIDIADFVYLSAGGGNLLVLCEVNYGGNGAPSYPFFAFSYHPNQHEKWYQHETPPTDPGVPDANRPNIQITYLPLSTPNPPSGFIANAMSTSQINLTWVKNSANNNVMVAFNTVDVFGTPSGSYVAGNAISGGGVVLYNGSASGYNQTAGLNPATTYYYKAWSVLPPTPSYSTGSNASATTLCGTLTGFPYTIGFESPVFPPVCWSLAQKPWQHNGSVSAFGTGTGATFCDFFTINAGNSFDLISPTLNISALASPTISFDHAYASYSGEVDLLELWTSSNDGVSFSLLQTWLGGMNGPLNTGGGVTVSFIPTSGQWASKSYGIPAGTNKILLRGVSGYGNNLYLDNITIGNMVLVWNGSASGQWHNTQNWTPNVVPTGIQDVTIPVGTPNSPVVSTSGHACMNMNIQSDANLTVLVGNTLTINGNVTIHSGATLTNNGSISLKGNLVNLNIY